MVTQTKWKVIGPFSKPIDITSFEMKPLLSNEDYEQSKILKEYDPHMEFLNVKINEILTEKFRSERITSGRANFKLSTEVTNKLKALHQKSKGTLDVENQEFLHNGGNFVSIIGACQHCRNQTSTFCKGCKEFYCSQTCWAKSSCNCSDRKSSSPSYRSRIGMTENKENLIVRSVVQMTSRSKILKQLLQRSIKPCEIPSKNKLVAITSVIDHAHVFLRSMEPADDNEYIQFLNDVVAWSKTAETLKEMPKVGDIVLAKFEGIYYRALVVRIEEDMVVVAYLEFGNLEKKSLSDLKGLHANYQFKKRFTFKACLSGVEGELLSDKALAYLYNLLERDLPLKFNSPNEKCSSKGVLCELVETDSHENVNIKVTTLNSVKVVDKFLADVCTSLSSTNASLIVLNNDEIDTGYITVIPKEYIPKVIMMQNRISEYCKQDFEGSYAPINYEICLAKYDDAWYRVQMGESVGDGKPTMVFSDFGNVAKVDVSNMRPMPSEFYYPCYAVYAKIGDIPEKLTEEQIVKLMDYFPVQSTIIVDKCVSTSADGRIGVQTIIYCKDLKL